MTDDNDQMKELLRSYILDEYLPGESPSALKDSTPLFTGGILDSMSMVKLVHFLEERFGIHIQPHEMDFHYLNTIDRIMDTVQSKV